MKMLKNMVFATILFVGFTSAAGETIAIDANTVKETVTVTVEAGVDAGKNVVETVAQQGFFSHVASGIKHVVWTAPTTFISNHKLLTAFVVAGVVTGAVAAYIILNEEEAEEAF